MPDCYNCKLTLQGSWDLGVCVSKSERHLSSSKDAYFLGNGSMLRSFCKSCFNKQVREEPELTPKQRLGKVANEVSAFRVQKLELTTEISNLERKKHLIINEITALQLQKEKAECEIPAIQQQKDKLVDEITELESRKEKEITNLHQITEMINKASQEKNQIVQVHEELTKRTTGLVKEANVLTSRIKTLRKQVDDILGKTGMNNLLSVIEGFTESEAQQLKFEKGEFTSRLSECISTAVTGFVRVSRGKLLSNIAENSHELSKSIEKNEKATEIMLATMQNACVPESVKEKIILEMRGHVLALREQRTKWCTITNKISSITCA